MRSLICPVSSERVEEYVVRLTGFFIAILLFASVYFHHPLILWIVVADYIVRSFIHQYRSPLTVLARTTIKHLNVHSKQIDKAPKIFAARIGFAFALSGALLFSVSPVFSTILLCILLIFTLLESVGNFCAGCLMYTYIKKQERK